MVRVRVRVVNSRQYYVHVDLTRKKYLYPGGRAAEIRVSQSSQSSRVESFRASC